MNQKTLWAPKLPKHVPTCILWKGFPFSALFQKVSLGTRPSLRVSPPKRATQNVRHTDFSISDMQLRILVSQTRRFSLLSTQRAVFQESASNT